MCKIQIRRYTESPLIQNPLSYTRGVMNTQIVRTVKKMPINMQKFTWQYLVLCQSHSQQPYKNRRRARSRSRYEYYQLTALLNFVFDQAPHFNSAIAVSHDQLVSFSKTPAPNPGKQWNTHGMAPKHQSKPKKTNWTITRLDATRFIIGG